MDNATILLFSELLLPIDWTLGSVGVRPSRSSPQKKIMFFGLLVYDLGESSLPEMAVS